MSRTKDIYIYGEIGLHYNSKDLLNDLKNFDDGYGAINVHINSIGGDVNEGHAIYNILSNHKNVTTIIEGQCYSIATVIFLAGKKRKMYNNTELMIHNPWAIDGGDSSKLKKTANRLQEIENELAEFYSKSINKTVSEVKEMMKDETYIDSKQAKELNFATEIIKPLKAMAKFNPNIMSDKKRNNTLVDKFKGLFKVKNLMLADINGIEVDFPELTEGDTPFIGDTATVDGKVAEGEVVLPDNMTYTFANGKLTGITVSESQKQEDDNEGEGEDDQMKAILDIVKENQTAMASLKTDTQKQIDEIKKLTGGEHSPQSQNRGESNREESNLRSFKPKNIKS